MKRVVCCGVLLHFSLDNDPCHLSPALYPTGRGGNFSLQGANQTSDFDYRGAQLHPLNSFEITRIADGQNLFPSVAMLLVKQMECSERWCEQNDDTTISIIALACAYVISIDFNGLCEEKDKSSYHWARHLDWWYTALLRFGSANPVTFLSSPI